MRVALTVDLPEELETTLKIAGYTPRRSLAVTLFTRKVLSLGQAARLAGMSLWDFIPFLGTQGIPLADYDDAEADNEVETARWIAGNPKK